MIARLRPNVAVQQSDAEVRSLVKDIAENYPTKIKQVMQRWAHFSLESQTVPFRTEFSGDVQRPLLLLMAAAGIVLLIGCADVANLMFSRMVGRQREFALRTALGAGHGRLARQTLTEGLFLSVMGGTIGFTLACWTLPILVRLAPDTLPRLNEVGVNWRITVFSAAVTLATPLIFCLAPLLDTMRPAAASRLRGEGRTSTQSKRQRRVMSGAIIVQFSLAFLLLTTAGLLLRSFIRASEANPGFQPEHVLSMRIALPRTTYRTPPQIANLFDRLLARLSALPGVQRFGAISELPTGSSSDVVLSIEGRGGDSERVDTFSCLGDALDSLRIQLLKGRLLRPEDYAGQPHAAVISASLARRVWRNDEEAIGKRVKFGVDDPMNDQAWLTVVGVVADVRAKLTSDAPRLALFTTSDSLPDTMDVVVRTSVDPLSLASALRYEVSQLDPHLPADGIQTIDRILNESLSPERFRTWLLSAFAIAAMLLATLGIAGLLAYNAAQRMQEFGLRVALGASRRNLMGMVLRDCLRMSATGIAVGLSLSLAATRLLSVLLYDTSPLDPATFIAVPSILMLVAIGAAVFPAWRVIHADPMTALRAE
jgi:predicted permease